MRTTLEKKKYEKKDVDECLLTCREKRDLINRRTLIACRFEESMLRLIYEREKERLDF